jgi:hypothetical protein
MWRGEEPLALAFWQYAVVFGLVLDVVHIFLVWAVNSSHAPGVVVAATYLLPVPYYLFTAWAVWRAAARYDGPPLWASAARAAIIPWTVVAIAL